MGYYEKKIFVVATACALFMLVYNVSAWLLCPEPAQALLFSSLFLSTASCVIIYAACRFYFSQINKHLRMLSASEDVRHRTALILKQTELEPVTQLIEKDENECPFAYEQLFLIANQPMIIYQQDETVIDFNHSFEAYTGFSRTRNGFKQKFTLRDLMPKEQVRELLEEDDAAARIDWRCVPEGTKPAVLMAKQLRDNNAKKEYAAAFSTLNALYLEHGNSP